MACLNLRVEKHFGRVCAYRSTKVAMTGFEPTSHTTVGRVFILKYRKVFTKLQLKRFQIQNQEGAMLPHIPCAHSFEVLTVDIWSRYKQRAWDNPRT